MMGCPASKTRIPVKNANDPFSLCHWKKNENVFRVPMMNERPAKKNI